jgi:uncharacterized protein DUF1579
VRNHPLARARDRSSRLRASLPGLALCLVAEFCGAQALEPLAPDIAGKLDVLDRFRGTWDVTVKTRQPKASVVTYTETFGWILEHRFLRGDSGRKSDGTQDVMMTTYDQPTGGYPFWIFSSSGAYIYLAPGTWDETSRTFLWKNPPGAPVEYVSRCVFPDNKVRRCTSTVKDWKGKVLLEQEVSAARRP